MDIQSLGIDMNCDNFILISFFTEEYENDLPQPSIVPIPLPRKQDKDPKDRPASVQIDTSQSIYEELDISSRPSS